MNSIQLKSRAKINLSIDVLGKREDGYHLVEMIMQTIDLFDKIKIFSLKEDTIIIESNSLDIPLDSTNIVYKAADLIKKQYNIKEGVKIIIEKNIPIAAGMAGGSSNAAAVLVGLNQLWQLKLSENKLKELGLKLGADVPFCIGGQTALAENIGEKLTKIDGLSENIFILVCKPELFVSTKEIYEEIDSKIIEKRPNNKLLIIKDSYANCFLPFLTSHYGEINVVDLRYYYDDLDKLIENREITDVLFLYNSNTFNSDDSILNIEN